MFKKNYLKVLSQEYAQRLVCENCKDYLKSLVEIKEVGCNDKFHTNALFHGGKALLWENGFSADYMLISTKFKDASTGDYSTAGEPVVSKN